MEGVMKALGLDPYQRAAQLYPALLAVWPPIATGSLWFPEASAVVKTLAGVTILGALVMLIMQYGRARGRAVQSRIVARMGGLPSTLALRHRDNHVPAELKKRYHATLRKKGFPIPTAEQEALNPAEADGCYASVSGWLPHETRDVKKFPLLHVENRSYGFRRNLLGLKPTGLLLTSFCLVLDIGLLWWLRTSVSAPLTAGIILAVLLTTAALAWLLVVNERFVEDAGWAYATQQLAACEKLPASRQRKQVVA